MPALKNTLKTNLQILICCALLLCEGSTPFAAPYSPKVGSKERTAILNALRVPAQKQAKQKIVFLSCHDARGKRLGVCELHQHG